MSYPKLEFIPKSKRCVGRKFQDIGGKKVAKFAFSPFTAKSEQRYTFYADVEMEIAIDSPPGSGKKRKFLSTPVVVGTYLEFRDQVVSGEVMEKINVLVTQLHGGSVVSVSYWRNKGERNE